MTKRPDDGSKSDIAILQWKKNRSEQIRIVLSPYKGRTMVSLRVWYFDPESLSYKPGKTGINLETRHLERLSKGIRKARKKAASLGWDTAGE